MASNYLASVPKLKGRENYNDWAFAVENMLVLDGLSACIAGTESSDKDKQAKAKLILTIDASLYVHIKEVRTTKDLWTKLKSLFDDSGFTRRINLLRTLISTRLDDCDSMGSYVNQIVETAQKLRGTGFNIDEEWIGSLLLAGLPEKFSPMIMAIEHSGIAITADCIKTKLMDMESEIGKTGSAFAGKDYKSDHKSHVSSTSKPADRNVKYDKKDVKCYKCKQTGHFQNKCPKKSNDSKHFNSKNSKCGTTFSAVFLSGQFRTDEWYIDSGASVHLTARKDWLERVCENTNLQEIMVANKVKIPVSCQGDVNITTTIRNSLETEKFDITIKDVLYAPDLTTNLLSVSQLIKNGNKVKFEYSGCKIFNNQGELVATADLVDNVYRLNIDKSEKCLLASNNVTAEIWHRRLGHINYNDLNKMKNGIVEGIVCQSDISKTRQNCLVCCEGKQSRYPFNHKGSRANGLLEIVHADVCGPMEVHSIGGSRYFVIFEDDFSRMTFVYFLKTKDSVFESFKDFKNMVENQQSLKIKILKSDNGGEFCSQEFENFLKKTGIVHQKTNPYTPEQNGVSERMNRTVVEKARCLLFDAGLEKKFWAEAVNTAVYIRNRSVASGLNNKTPLETWTGRKPDVSNIRIFGSTAMVHIPKCKWLKWNKKSIRMILVGFADNTKGYRVYNPRSDTIITSRDVVVMENTETTIKIMLNPNEGTSKDSNAVEDSVGEASNTESKIEENISDTSGDSDEYMECVQDDEVTPPVRRSERKPKPKNYEDFVTFMCKSENTRTELNTNPLTVTEALSRIDKDKWKQAMAEEISSFEENDAWQLVDPPASGTIVDCKWVFKRKPDSENKIRYRARLVAKGFTQRQGIDYDETFSPVVRYSTLRLLFALSVKLNLEIRHLDVTTAFLNGFLQEDVYMKQPDGFIKEGSDKTKVLKLKRAIYGLKQSSRAWYKRVDEVLLKLGYKRSDTEPCLYVKSRDKLITMITVYVDDFLIFSNDNPETESVKKELSSKFKIKDLGKAKDCLGLHINRDYDKGFITLDQRKYIDQILKQFNMSDCKSVSTPMDNSIPLNSENDNVFDKNVPYRQLIGSLMYLAVLTRPDISFSVSFLSQFNDCYTNTHWQCAKRILRYLQGTKDYCLKYVRGDTELKGYVDADWASNVKDRKSYTGFVFMLSGSAISWESKKQKTVALSSCEAEYMALAEASKEAMYFRSLLFELTKKLYCITLYNDNQSAQKLSVNPVYHKRSKHIDVRYHFIRDAVSNNYVKILYLPSADMTADVLTKSLSTIKHNKFINDLGLVST